MAYSHMASIDDATWSCNFRPSSFTDTWFSDAICCDTQTLTKVLQQSLSNNSDSFSPDTAEGLSPFLSVPTPKPIDSATKRHRSSLPVVTSGKVSKRKPRKSKRSEMTFIYADPANFRQMVQQVTGSTFIHAQLPQVLKPEPQRPGVGGRCLETSATVGGGGDGLGFESIVCFPTLESWNNQ